MINFIKRLHLPVNSSAKTLKLTSIYRRQSTNQNRNISAASAVDKTKIYITKFVNGCRTVADSNEFHIAKDFVVKSSQWTYQMVVKYYKNNIEKGDERIKSIGDSSIPKKSIESGSAPSLQPTNIEKEDEKVKSIEIGSAPSTQPTLDTKQFIVVKNIKMREDVFPSEKSKTKHDGIKKDSSADVKENNIKKE